MARTRISTSTAAFLVKESAYPLRNSSILDSGTTLHLFNEITRFKSFAPSYEKEVVYAGSSHLPILGYGEVDLELRNLENKPRLLTLKRVAYCPKIGTNLVSLRRLRQQGYWWDQRNKDDILRHNSGQALCRLTQHWDQYVLEYLPESMNRASFVARRLQYNSWTERKPKRDSAIKWHRRLGHPGPRTLEHLVNRSKGARIRGITTVECDICGIAKMKRQEHREPRERTSKPGERVSIDFHDYPIGICGYTSAAIITDRCTGLMWDYYFDNRKDNNIAAMLANLVQMLSTRFDIKLRVIETDNEIRKGSITRDWLNQEGIQVEESAPRTQQQNGSGERSGGVVKEKARILKLESNLPSELWPEMVRTAVYLLNRTPKYRLAWRTPYESFFSGIPTANAANDYKPKMAHLRVIGSKAFALTDHAQLKDQRLKSRTTPKAWIGYLVGYNSQNIFRVWNPVTNRVYITRDVIFNEEERFDENEPRLRETIGESTLEEIQARLEALLKSEQVDQVLEPAGSEDEPEVRDTILDDLTEDMNPGKEREDGDQQGEEAKYTSLRFEPLPTPPESPAASFLACSIETGKEHHKSDLLIGRMDIDVSPMHQAFNAGRLAIPIGKNGNTILTKGTRSRIGRRSLKPQEEVQTSETNVKMTKEDYHRRRLPPEPGSHSGLKGHKFEKQFKDAEQTHLESHRQMKSWIEASRSDPRIRNSQILDCMWVYTYKLDKHGYLRKCKARLVVRGDQQQKATVEETYASTLAGRSFRTLLAIAAKFDLEMLQFDAVNAFVNAKLPSEVFMRMPPGYRDAQNAGKILVLQKALYGLRIAPLLWQKELGGTLTTLGFKPTAHEPCCYSKEGILLFFYVDDIVITFRKDQKGSANRVIEALKTRYKLTGGNDIQWFLGMEVIRDRPSRTIWVTQNTYLEKIYTLRNSDRKFTTPMSKTELVPNEEAASHKTINWYRRVIGSLLYAAVITRPDVAFAVSRLARFMSNPSDEHCKAADRVLNYLFETRFYALKFEGTGNDFIVYSDASFADNTCDRKSSQAYAMRLYGSLIGWRANKQDTVTTSTTEAELLALSQAAKEGLFQERLLGELGVELRSGYLRLICDNQQTIRLLERPLERLKTKLRHVDVHNHWLREHVQKKTICISYERSANLIADGLTKALQGDQFIESRKQLSLCDIKDRILERRKEDLRERSFSEILNELHL